MKKNLLIPIISLISIIIIGSVGFHLIEGESLTTSLYWTIVTITTVGYGDVTPITETGKVFSIILIVVGIGTILYILSAIGRNIIEGRIWEVFTMRKKSEEVEKLENHLLVCGYGDVGRTITQELQLGNEDIVIIDQNIDPLQGEGIDLPFVVGDATKEEILENAKINKARGLFAALPGDSDNILLTLSAKDINPEIRIIAKAETNERAKHLRRAGAEAIVLPEKEGGIRRAGSFLHPEITSLYNHLLMENVGRSSSV